MESRIPRRFVFLFLLILTCLALSIRVYKLGTNPEGVLVDEASIGYNAYSILKTGKDEWGVRLPVVFKAFGDYKLPAYIYATVPSTALFDMNAFSVRLPSAVAGTLLVPISFFFLQLLGLTTVGSLFGAGVVAFSPWTIILSRFGYESNLALVLFTAGMVCTLAWFKKKDIVYGVFAAIFLALTWYSYVAYRVAVPLIVSPLLLWALWKKTVQLKHVALFAVVYVVALVPLAPYLLSTSGTARFNQIGLLADAGPPQVILEKRNFCTTIYPTQLCYLLWNKGTVYGTLLIERFVSIISPDYLFLKGDAFLPYLNVDGYGQFFVYLLPIYFIGIAVVAQTTKKNQLRTLLVLIAIIGGSIPSLLAGEPQKIRLTPIILPLTVIMSLGFESVYMFTKRNLRPALVGILVLVCFTWTTSFIVEFLSIHVQKNDIAFNIHAAKMMNYLETVPKNVTIRVVPSFSDPLMHYAFHAKIDPNEYQSSIIWDKLESSGFQHAKQLMNIEVTTEPYQDKLCSLYVTDRVLGLKPSALQFTVRSSNGVHPYLFAYSSQAPAWCPSE
ncbi:MAG TPA: phospholipid carrier-dependent glycosyltransferase [Patescibacteria group bacterium]|nr:phospholipid carrier-dependent glycosyltransferase [Patescibacteria group bacterium]